MFVQAGAQAPERLRINVSNAELAAQPLDLSTVTAAEFVVVTPRGDRVTWGVTISDQTEDLLILEHGFEANDVSIAGNYQIDVRMTVPGGIRRAGPTALQVIE